MSDNDTPDKDATEQPDGRAEEPAAPRPRTRTAGTRAAGTRATGARTAGGRAASGRAASGGAEANPDEAAGNRAETSAEGTAEAGATAQRRGGQTFEGLGSLRQAMAQATRPTPTPTAAPLLATAPEDVQPKRDAFGRSYATGKRKNAVARVWIRPGNGKIEVNGRDSPVYFARPVLRMLIGQPLAVSNRNGQYDVICRVSGGGLVPIVVPDQLQAALISYGPVERV